jgi:glycerol-3-phosphate dehydrogenase
MTYDVCIIGGGINGLAIAEQCGRAGLRTSLFEKDVIGAGASTKTSKLAHGGLRYLEQFQFSLVKEALQEREVLIKRYPSLVKRLPFIFPIFKGMFEPKVWAGLKIYDFLAGKKSTLPKSKRISVNDVSDKLSWLDMTDVKSGYMYWDAVMNDYQILEDTAINAKRYMVDIFEHEPVHSYNKRDNLYEVTTSKKVILSKVIINVTGAWANTFHKEQIVKPSKGVHIVTDSIYTSHASILRAPQDNRVFFTIPYYGDTIIGTTDTYYDGDLDDVKATPDDIKYLLSAFNSFSKVKLGLHDILYTYAGLRPLACKSNKLFESSMSRDVQLVEDGNVLTLVGGKYTTHRSVASKTLKLILKRVERDRQI